MGHNSDFHFKSEVQRKKVMSLLGNRYGEKNPTHLQGQQNLVSKVHSDQDIAGLKASKKKDGMKKILSNGLVVLSENEIQNIKNNLNSGNDSRVAYGQELADLIYENDKGVRITEEQTHKGVEYLNRPNIRKLMGTSEEHVLDNFKEFRLIGFYNDNNGYRDYYVPEFKVIANDGSSFDYHGSSEGIEITG